LFQIRISKLSVVPKANDLLGKAQPLIDFCLKGEFAIWKDD
jgi:hypothetical protein